MTNQKNPEEQDLEINEETAEGVSGGVKAVEKTLVDADKASLTEPKLKAEL